MTARLALGCDAEGCADMVLVPKLGRQLNVADARAVVAVQRGWTTRKGLDYCPKHSKAVAK